ncbi:hypothetical protein [Streptomyces sp. NBC_00057]|uniref:hypothetical protein n=1 Tax=Streptomyces sp. NBC_00057 TaxID=2975634 RepID=UPI00324B8560
MHDAKGGTALSITQAEDDQMVHHYNVDITDASTGASVVSSKALADFYFMPRPNTLAIPVTGAVEGVARVVAVDVYGNVSPAASLTFGK